MNIKYKKTLYFLVLMNTSINAYLNRKTKRVIFI